MEYNFILKFTYKYKREIEGNRSKTTQNKMKNTLLYLGTVFTKHRADDADNFF